MMSSRLARRTTRWNWVVPTIHQGWVASIYRAAESKVFSEVCRCKGVRYGDTQTAERWFGRASVIDRAQLKGREAIYGGRPQQNSGSPAAAPTKRPPQELGQAGWHVGKARGCFHVPLNETATTTSCDGASYSEVLGLLVFSASKVGGIRGSRTLLPDWHAPPTHIIRRSSPASLLFSREQPEQTNAHARSP